MIPEREKSFFVRDFCPRCKTRFQATLERFSETWHSEAYFLNLLLVLDISGHDIPASATPNTLKALKSKFAKFKGTILPF